MTRLLTEADKATVSEAIKQAELRTTGELITVIAPASDDYWFIPSLWASLIALTVPAIFILIGTWWDTTTLFSIQIGTFLVLVTLFRIPLLKYALVPKSIKHLRASRVAREQFFLQGLQNTEGRTGILLFVSVAEHYVEVIADKGINDRVPEGTWDKVVRDFVLKVKEKQHMQGFVAAIEDCGNILAEHFPAQAGNKNELSNHLIEL
ncbi:MAG: TPM domain-containing protein [Gammaproteobacteria bacterium]|nr:TPM domain-containing protein [Gammaproteobacteria bacterium]